MINLAEKIKCSACGACYAVCPSHSIIFYEDEIDMTYPTIQKDKCIECGMCDKVCYAKKHLNTSFPIHAYASWSNDRQIMEKAASGGVASEIYRFCIENDIFCMGTRYIRSTGVVYRTMDNLRDIDWARNSKYVQSDMTKVFEEYEKKLAENIKSLFIGLPCQVASLLAYLECKNVDKKKLITVDLVCHGVSPYKYLSNHLDYLESKKKKKIVDVSFRGPLSKYYFRCFGEDGRIIYIKGMQEDDCYYRSFGEALIFRENCYHCPFARYERISDITLGDYSGLGDLWEYEGRREMVSLVLSNTEKGDSFIHGINKIVLIERNICEPPSARGNAQLRRPSENDKRKEFRELYIKFKDANWPFEKAVKSVMRKEFLKYKIGSPKRIVKKVARNVLCGNFRKKTAKLLMFKKNDEE